MPFNSSPIQKSFVALIVFVIVGYGMFNSRFLIQGPRVVVEQVNAETNTIVTQDKTLNLTGIAEHSSFISINGRPITIDESGKFTEKLLLSSEMSIIDIYAKDKFGKEVRQKIDVVYQGETPKIDYAKVALEVAAIAQSTETSSTTLSATTTAVHDGEVDTQISATIAGESETGATPTQSSAQSSTDAQDAPSDDTTALLRTDETASGSTPLLMSTMSDETSSSR